MEALTSLSIKWVFYGKYHFLVLHVHVEVTLI